MKLRRWLGQFRFIRRMREWKPRFNCFWDWIRRLRQIRKFRKLRGTATVKMTTDEIMRLTRGDE